MGVFLFVEGEIDTPYCGIKSAWKWKIFIFVLKNLFLCRNGGFLKCLN